MTTLLELLQTIGDELGRASGTTTGKPVTGGVLQPDILSSLDYARLYDNSGDSPLDPGDSPDLYANAWLLIEGDSADPPQNVGECRRISSYTPSLSMIECSRVFNHLPTNTESYGIYLGAPPVKMGNRKGLREYVNAVLRGLRRRDLGLLTLVTDGDCEATGTTHWTANGTAVVAKATTGVTGGQASLSVTTPAGGDYVASASVPVLAGAQYSVCADCYETAGYGCQLVVWDVTNAAAIETLSTSALGQHYLAAGVTVPAGCQQLELRLSSVTAHASAVSYWDTLSLRSQTAHAMAAPAWLTTRAWLEDVVYRAGGTRADTNEAYQYDRAGLVPLHWWQASEEATGGLRVEFAPAPPVASHLFVQAQRPYAELTALDDTTTADPDLLKAWALVNLYTDLDNRAGVSRWYATALTLLGQHVPRPRPRAYMALRDF